MKTTKIRTYSELITLPTFEERFEYLKLYGKVGFDTFGFDRIFNQIFYNSNEWKDVKHYVIVRDHGCDLAHPEHKIYSKRIFVHHMNPIELDDIKYASDFLLNPEYLITTILNTHNAIHYANEEMISSGWQERTPYDTCPWKL